MGADFEDYDNDGLPDVFVTRLAWSATPFTVRRDAAASNTRRTRRVSAA